MSNSHRKFTSLVATVVGCFAMAGAAFAQQPSTTTDQASPGYSNPATAMPAAAPSKSETAPSAFQKLDTTHAGFVTKEQTAKLDGFDKAFTQADKNKDGKLTLDEFKTAWGLYTGNPQS